MFCPNCGKQLPDGSRFCSACGAQLDAQAGVQQQPYQSPSYEEPDAPAPTKKKGVGVIVGIAAAAVVLGLVLFVYPGVLLQADTYPVTPPAETVEQGKEPSGQTLIPAADNQAPAVAAPAASEGPSVFPAAPPEAPDASFPSEQNETSVPPAAVIDPAANEAANPDASFFSTDADAAALEFDWFLDMVFGDGSLFFDAFRDAEDVTDPALLDGGWKAYLHGNGENDNDLERYFHADLLSSGQSGRLTFRWKYLFIPSSGTVEEEGSSDFSGSWSDGQLYATSAYGAVKLDRCFTANGKQYAYGSFQWNSGEIDYLALMRP